MQPFTEYSLKLQALIVESKERSEYSDTIEVTTHEGFPGEPRNLRIAGATTSLIKIQWDPPEKMNGALKGYFIYKDNVLLEQTNETSYILTGLQPITKYDVHVCASTSMGKGPKSFLATSTCDLGDTLPEKPTFTQIGRKELLVKWQPPQVITGKLNRYELIMNSKCVYSGLANEYQVCLLKPDTEYSFEVFY